VGGGKEILRLLHPSRPTRDLAVTHHTPLSTFQNPLFFSFHDTRHTYEMRITRRSHTGIHYTSPALRQPTYAEAYAVVRKQAALQIKSFAQSTFRKFGPRDAGFQKFARLPAGWPSKCAQRAVAGVLLGDGL
jgi:hypothetical protein